MHKEKAKIKTIDNRDIKQLGHEIFELIDDMLNWYNGDIEAVKKQIYKSASEFNPSEDCEKLFICAADLRANNNSEVEKC